MLAECFQVLCSPKSLCLHHDVVLESSFKHIHITCTEKHYFYAHLADMPKKNVKFVHEVIVMYKLPLKTDLYDIETLKLLSTANNKIGELKGMMNLLPNPKILLNAITLGEAKDSSEIENIVTTYDEIYKEMTSRESISVAAKEVLRYRRAVSEGFRDLQEKEFISINSMISIQSIIEPNRGGVRQLPGTVKKNNFTGEIVHTPPQSRQEIMEYLDNLEQFINENEDYDPLINMALIHFQFESIHPFYDGNGRTGRILNILYLVMKRKIDQTVLYLSKYIIKNKSHYYELLKQAHQGEESVRDFICYMLQGVLETSEFTIGFIQQILKSMDEADQRMKRELPKIHSKELVDYLYYEFYTKNEFIRKELNVSRNTAAVYLNELEEHGFLVSERVGKEKIYKNTALFSLIKG